jgi:hypothetical protein
MSTDSPDQRLLVDVRGAGEWIVSASEGERSLHVYRLESDDWLVSEVGCANEGRGANLRQALAALPVDLPPPQWWTLVPGTLDSAGGPEPGE